MATYYEYKCKGCGYTVNSNPKGKDMVMMGELYSYHCKDCNEIVDVSCAHGEKPEEICPKCGSKNISYWTRIIGYLRPVEAWGSDRQIEGTHRVFKDGNDKGKLCLK